MSEWKKSKLGDVVIFQRGHDLTEKSFVQGIYPVAGSNGIINYHNEYTSIGPGLTLGRSGNSIGVTHFYDTNFWAHNTTLYSKEFKNSCPKFLYYLLKTINFKAFNTGSAVPSLNRNHINLIDILVPPLPEQRAIASVLSSLDDKIDLLHQQNQTLEKMAETLFRKWFVEEAREEWKVVKIKDFDIIVTDFVANGSFASLKENVTLINDHEDYALFIRNTDLKSDFINKVFVDEHSYNFLSKTKLYGGEVIISSVGDVGSVFRCPKFKIPMTLGNNVVMLKSNYNLFFYLFFKSDYGQSLLYGITSGSVQEKFNKTAFRDLKFTFPNLSYLDDFETNVSPYFSKIDCNKDQIRTLTTLRDTLLPKLMSGEVRVAN